MRILADPCRQIVGVAGPGCLPALDTIPFLPQRFQRPRRSLWWWRPSCTAFSINRHLTKQSLFWKTNIDHAHLNISKHWIRNGTLPVSQALDYFCTKHRPLFCLRKGISCTSYVPESGTNSALIYGLCSLRC